MLARLTLLGPAVRLEAVHSLRTCGPRPPLRTGPVVVAYSPVTGMAYNMQRGSGFAAHRSTGVTVPSVSCVGGNDAVVVLF